ncbi:hypothetical protein ACF06W_16490 [Streptomyces albus]|uniref:hypothetical protein n=1 Tax=Streptomyces albus TaxID=1888 RepID=UPI0037027E5C
MPAHLRPATYTNVVEAVDLLQEVLRYCAPDRAAHGWARMCMYRASDAMDTIGRLTGVIAAQLSEDGMGRAAIQRLLHAERECSRTDRPPHTACASHSKRDLFYMPSPLRDRVQRSVARVVLSLQQVVKQSEKDRNKAWFRHCLYWLSTAMDELGMLNREMATLNAGHMNRETLARYQHLFQQRHRSSLPDAEDRMYLVGLMGRRDGGDQAVWNMIGRGQAKRRQVNPVSDSHDGRVLWTLAALDRKLQPFRWIDENGVALDRTRTTAVAYLNAVSVVEGNDGEYPPLYWLGKHERDAAAVIADQLFHRGNGRQAEAKRGAQHEA